MARISVTGLIYQSAYIFQRHTIFGWSLTRWLTIALIAGPALGFFKVLPLGQTGTTLTAIVSAGILFSLWRIKRRGYLRFTPGRNTRTTQPQPLSFSNKVDIRVSGKFAVGGASRYFVDAPAQYQTFETRERVIMVNIVRTRFLLIARSPEEEVGWWYTFFSPLNLRDYECGTLHFGLRPRPAIRLVYQSEETDKAETVYLSFDSPDSQVEILADLLADKPNLFKVKNPIDPRLHL